MLQCGRCSVGLFCCECGESLIQLPPEKIKNKEVREVVSHITSLSTLCATRGPGG